MKLASFYTYIVNALSSLLFYTYAAVSCLFSIIYSIVASLLYSEDN